MKKKVVVLGAGMVGRAMAADLSDRYHVTAADLSAENLERLPAGIASVQADLSRPEVLHRIVAPADLVIGAVPGFMGFATVQHVLECGKNIVDISFFAEDCFELDALAQQRQVTAIVDCGVAPGLFNIVAGYHHQRMQVDNLVAMCGGLPVRRTLPFQYKAPFSPVDVLEIYTRPARIVVNGSVRTVPALSNVEEVHLEPVGTLEAFDTDGLRSMLRTMKIPNMCEKTLRYPGHAALMKALRAMGLFSESPLMVNGQQVKPIDFACALLFPHWKLEPGEEEFTLLSIQLEGREQNEYKCLNYHLYDRYDPNTQTTSMARTTGYTATAAASAVLEGLYTRKGISPPEYLGEQEPVFHFIMDYLAQRNLRFTVTSSKSPAG
ncbi:MAG: saccharopine dehydrogenase C-terminal domain-containing protein [Chitinophagales bacterium]|nr:saccharopine dehydrogenase NADP-binding domain-containing protein [Chitinophagales bacterium]MDW8394118.1 saccharopine dehydrogenase C-terminal domain-containing protein [Chitinophagales bacterium]